MESLVVRVQSAPKRMLMILAALFGLADSAYLADMAFAGKELLCDIRGLDGCNTVAQSAYSWVLGYPLALYGVIFYVVFVCVLLSSSYMSRTWSKGALGVLALAGAVFSTYFVYLQQFVIHALCIYCLGSALISYILAYLVYCEIKEEGD